MSAAAPAKAIDVKVSGYWDFAFGWVTNNNFHKSVANRKDSRASDPFEARQRVRVQTNFIASENLQALLLVEIGDLDWGRARGNSGRGSGGALDADGVNIETKRAFLDWIVPNTSISVRMGIQNFAFPFSPHMGCNPVFDADVAGIVVSSPVTDWLSLTAAWLRPFDHDANDGDRSLDDEVDLFALIMPMRAGQYGSFTPYFMYGFMGGSSGYLDYIYGTTHDNRNYTQNSHFKSWWVGANLSLEAFDPLLLSVDAMYGRSNGVDISGWRDPVTGASYVKGPGSQNYDNSMISGNQLSSRGWYIGATLDYKLDCFTPGVFGWYASGDDDDAKKTGRLGRLPVVGTDGSFGPTSFGSHNFIIVGNAANKGTVMSTGMGTWGVGIQVADISVIEDLTHTLRFTYYRGTNDADLVKNNGGSPLMPYTDKFYLTDKDYIFEINFDHKYKIYENLTAIVQLGYIRLHADEDTWAGGGNALNHGSKENQNSFKAELAFRYSF